MVIVARLFVVLSLLFLTASFVSGQDDLPKAVLRVNEMAGAKAEQEFYIEVTADVALKDSIYQELTRPGPPTIGVLTSKGQPLADSGSFKNLLLISPQDNGSHKVFRIYLPHSFAPFTDFEKKKFAVVLTNDYKSDADVSQIRSISVGRVLGRELATDYPVCRRNQFGMSIAYDLKDEYSVERAKQLYDYLDGLRRNPAELRKIKISVEPLTREQVETRYATGMTIAPRNRADLQGLFSVCLSTDGNVPTEKFDAKLELPDPPVELVDPPVVPGLGGLAEESDPIVFPDKEKGVGIRPVDKDLNVAVSYVSSVKDEEQPDKTFLRKRNTVGTLDLRVGLFRNLTQLTVKSIKTDTVAPHKECGTVSEYKPGTAPGVSKIVIGRKTLDVAPNIELTGFKSGDSRCLHYKWVGLLGEITDRNPGHPEDPVITPYISAMEDPDTTAGTYNIFTPFYFDAKVSTGKITEDTSSLNRVFFGIQDELRYYANNNRFPTYYRFIFKGNHVSDRDFKQREFDVNIEFKPVIGALNHPFDPSNTRYRPRELCPDCKPPYKLLPIRYGFEFVPVIGVEIGKTYWRHRPAEALKPSDTVRRLYFGMDITLNPTPRWTLSASEIFYLRYESKTDRQHNYFLAESSYRFGSFHAGQGSHSLFSSWERGGQPPFDDPDVNVLKFGYRLTGTTIFSRFH